MKQKRNGLREKLNAIGWAYKVAWGIDKKPMLIWYSLSVLLAVLPAVALYFNRAALAVISGFLSGGAYTYTDVVPSVVALGVTLTLIGPTLPLKIYNYN